MLVQDTHQRKRTILKQLIKSNIFVILMSVLNSWYNKAQKKTKENLISEISETNK